MGGSLRNAFGSFFMCIFHYSLFNNRTKMKEKKCVGFMKTIEKKKAWRRFYCHFYDLLSFLFQSPEKWLKEHVQYSLKYDRMNGLRIHKLSLLKYNNFYHIAELVIVCNDFADDTLWPFTTKYFSCALWILPIAITKNSKFYLYSFIPGVCWWCLQRLGGSCCNKESSV